MCGNRLLVMITFVSMTLGVSNARAALITFYWGGTITEIIDPAGGLDGLLAEGDSFDGSYTFDPDTPDRFPDNLSFGYYVSDLASMTVEMGNLLVSASGETNSIGVVYSDGPGDYYSMGASRFSYGNIWIKEFFCSLRNSTSDVFISDALPSIPPPLQEFQGRKLSIDAEMNSQRVIVNGLVTYLTPEPATLLSLIAASVVVLTRRGDRRCG